MNTFFHQFLLKPSFAFKMVLERASALPETVSMPRTAKKLHSPQVLFFGLHFGRVCKTDWQETAHAQIDMRIGHFNHAHCWYDFNAAGQLPTEFLMVECMEQFTHVHRTVLNALFSDNFAHCGPEATTFSVFLCWFQGMWKDLPEAKRCLGWAVIEGGSMDFKIES